MQIDRDTLYTELIDAFLSRDDLRRDGTAPFAARVAAFERHEAARLAMRIHLASAQTAAATESQPRRVRRRDRRRRGLRALAWQH